MKLTNRELRLVKNLDQVRKQKVWGLLGVAAVLVLYWVLRYAGVLRGFDIPFDSLLMFYLAFLVGDTFSHLRVESRHLELLRRYVNNDAETLTALSERK